MSLSLQDRATLEKQLADLQAREDSNSVTSDGVASKEKDAAENERVAKELFNQYHLPVINYESEIEALIGEFITSPFTESDVVNHSNESGRLYQGTVSTSPKKIQEMIGGGISSTKRSLYELSNFTPLKDIVNTIVEGKKPYGSGSSSVVYDYTSGDSAIKTSSPLTPGWYCVNGTTLLKLSTYTHIPGQPEQDAHCSLSQYESQSSCTLAGGTWYPAQEEIIDHYIHVISEKHSLGFDVSAPAGSSIYVWSGYSNTERQNRTASSTTQSMMNSCIALLNSYTDKWITCLNKACVALNNNPDKNMRSDEMLSTIQLKNYVVDYRATTLLQDDVIQPFLSSILSREVFIPTRVQHCRDDKSKYYNDRYSMCKFRCDIQTGTLTRVKFLETIRGFYPTSGDPTIKEQILKIKNILQSG